MEIMHSETNINNGGRSNRPTTSASPNPEDQPESLTAAQFHALDQKIEALTRTVQMLIKQLKCSHRDPPPSMDKVAQTMEDGREEKQRCEGDTMRSHLKTNGARYETQTKDSFTIEEVDESRGVRQDRLPCKKGALDLDTVLGLTKPPFTDDIMWEPLLRRFLLPKLERYKGKSDLADHFSY
uniref:Uncharacterized protein n=1 Tax=Davidia involucrata TaxID=16924 RepID=A0A5B7BVM2_DAVIN